MSAHSILLLGGPDSGKTNYLARLWIALRSRKGPLVMPTGPLDIKYVETAAQHILQGAFAPRSDRNVEEFEKFDIPLRLASQPGGPGINLTVPDVSGELWKAAVERGEIALEWRDALEQSSGALLFLRIGSDQIVDPLDWVTAAEYLSLVDDAPGDDLAPAEETIEEPKIPTQVALCEMLRFLGETLADDAETPPRVAVVITAWDLLDPETRSLGPSRYLEKYYPLFAGRIADCEAIDIRVFGVSIVGGDFSEDDFKQGFYNAKLDDTGYIVWNGDNGVATEVELTLPVSWVVEPLFSDA